MKITDFLSCCCGVSAGILALLCYIVVLLLGIKRKFVVNMFQWLCDCLTLDVKAFLETCVNCCNLVTE